MADTQKNSQAQGDLGWARATGVLLLIAAVALNRGALAWLLTPDQSIAAGSATVLIVLLQLVLAIAGIALLVRPALVAGLAALSSVVLGAAAVAALIGVIASIGVRVSPPVDNRVANYPDFSCSPDDAFCNRATEAGIKDVKRYGKGTAFADINGDGWTDLYAADAEPRLRDDWGMSSFYLNTGDGNFRPVDLGISEADLEANWSGGFADIDNDGDQDLLLAGGGYAGEGLISLYENRFSSDERFVSITSAAGLDEVNGKPQSWWGIAWADYDNDGYLDFIVSRRSLRALLFRNNGDRSFRNVTDRMGVVTNDARERDGKNIVWFDYDNDGDLDLYLAGINSHNFFENLEGKYLLDITEEVFAGVFPTNWIYDAGSPVVFSAAAADFNQDGFEDLYLGRQVEQDLVMFNNGDGSFTVGGTDVGIDTELRAKNSPVGNFENTMGLGVGDLLDDGWPDVIIGTGDPVRADEDVVFCNKRGRFERCTELLRSNAEGLLRTRTHGIAFGDVNHDGRIDVFQNFGGHAPWDQKSGIDSREHAALFVANSLPATNTATVILEGVTANRDAIGARLKSVAEETHYYTIRSVQAFQSQNERAVILALGTADSALVEVTWPGGAVTEARVEAGSRTVLREAEGAGR